ncbi:hypothetical protein BU251_04075 [Candidatus Velamenicoccus archaeovorus]|uniref:Peptidase U32 n=1 Tax=Velamenicoccus archaeovorus TaxID=1930593 RepID=A0A410P4Q8_VELA1|nr:hypothetical protein [Candidatus Velamenicoccus archaeovorus]QAT16964.1 hypothetical protein BU251_04075 [Candidatus Velamenicoccus archaeovorus]
MKNPKLKLSIPYNNDLALMKWAIATGGIYEIYFAGPEGDDHSNQYLNTRKASSGEIRQLIALCHRHKIKRNLLLNKRINFFDDLKRIGRYVKALEDSGGITSITLADPCIVPFLRKMFPKIALQSSVYMNIDSEHKIKEAVKMGMTEFTLDVSCNRDARALDAIRAGRKHLPAVTIKLLANHGCYLHCFYGGRHAEWPVLMEAARTMLQEGAGCYVGFMLKDGCQFATQEPADEIRRPYLRPEDLAFFEENGWADGIKIAYRKDDSRLLKTKISAYLARSFKGDLFTLAPSNKGPLPFICDNKAFPKDFIEHTTHCNQRCVSCRYCASVAQAAIKPKTSP